MKSDIKVELPKLKAHCCEVETDQDIKEFLLDGHEEVQFLVKGLKAHTIGFRQLTRLESLIRSKIEELINLKLSGDIFISDYCEGHLCITLSQEDFAKWAEPEVGDIARRNFQANNKVAGLKKGLFTYLGGKRKEWQHLKSGQILVSPQLPTGFKPKTGMDYLVDSVVRGETCYTLGGNITEVN